MKTLILTAAVVLIATQAFAGTVYTKEGGNVLKVTVTETVETVESLVYSELLTQKARKLEEIDNSYSSYLERNTILKDELAEIEKKITEAEKLGIKELMELKIKDAE